MTVTVNGDAWTVEDGATVADVVARLGAPSRGVAVAVDGGVVTRAAWVSLVLADGAAVEVITAVQGG